MDTQAAVKAHPNKNKATTMEDILNALTDEENQPHQYVGDPEGLKKHLAGAGKLEFSVRQTENGYILERHEPFRNNWIFRSAEKLASFIANELLQLPH